jgi:hypothetical protein
MVGSTVGSGEDRASGPRRQPPGRVQDEHAVSGPRVVCLCGSMRFDDQMREIAVAESLDGTIVLLPLVNMRRPDPRWSNPDMAAVIKARLDSLHLAKIDAAHEVVVVAPGGYIGESTSREIAYAAAQGKPIRYAVGGFIESSREPARFARPTNAARPNDF